MTNRNFDDDMPALRTEPIEFTLGGEAFHCVPDAPVGVIADLISSIAYNERGQQVFQLPNMRRFVEDVLLEEHEVVGTPAMPGVTNDDGTVTGASPDVMVTEATDDLDRWKALMRDKQRPIPIEQLAKVVVWLQEKYTAERPTALSRR